MYLMLFTDSGYISSFLFLKCSICTFSHVWMWTVFVPGLLFAGVFAALCLIGFSLSAAEVAQTNRTGDQRTPA